MNLKVANFGTDSVRKVEVSLQSAAYPNELSETIGIDSIMPKLEELPVILIDEILAGEIVTRRFPKCCHSGYFRVRPPSPATLCELPSVSLRFGFDFHSEVEAVSIVGRHACVIGLDV